MTSDSEAQSDAPSVDTLKQVLATLFSDGRSIGHIRAVTAKEWEQIIGSAEAKINRLITEARIDELKQLLGRQWWADDQHHEDEVVPYHHIEAQIKLLSNNLSKRDYNA